MVPVPLLFLILLLTAASSAVAQEARLPKPVYPDVVALAEAGRADAALEALDAQLKLRPTGTSQAAANLIISDVPVEALILRSRLLSKAGRFRDSAQSWLQ